MAFHLTNGGEAAEEKAAKKKLQIGVKKRVENCNQKSRRGDLLSMHYTVSDRLSFAPVSNGIRNGSTLHTDEQGIN